MLDFVKRLLNHFLENASKETMARDGVFIRSRKSDAEIIGACLQLLKCLKSDAKIVSLKREDVYGGVRLFFNSPTVVPEVLKKRFLDGANNHSTVHPMTTTFTIPDAFPSSADEFHEDLIEKFQTLGPVVKVWQIPVSKEYPDIGSGNWRIEINVPEVEDLDVFKRNGLPGNMFLELPRYGGKLAVKFHCRICDKGGHTQLHCPGDDESSRFEDSTNLTNQRVDSAAKAVASIRKMPSGFRIRDREEENRAICSNPKPRPALPRKDIEAFESKIGIEEASRYCNSSHIVKQEPGTTTHDASRRPAFTFEDNIHSPPNKKARTFGKEEISHFDDEDTQPSNFPKASSTTNDQDRIQIVSNTSNSTFQGSFSFPRGSLCSIRNSSEESPLVSTSNQPETVKREHPSDDYDSDSKHQPSTAKRKLKSHSKGVPLVIPDRIKEIIASMTARKEAVLNVKQLEAFFNHVKKKSRPSEFAKNYTDDVDGLKRQLESISKEYYMTTQIGAKEVIEFMKWFRGMIQRFDGIPARSRKPKAENIL